MECLFGLLTFATASSDTTIQSLEVFVDTKQRSPCHFVDTPHLESKIRQLFIDPRQSLGLRVDSPDMVGLDTLDLYANQVNHYKEEASRMADLIVHLEAPLKNSNNHVGGKADSVMIFTVFPPFTLSPRHPHSLHSNMTYFFPFILSYLIFLYLIFSRSHDQDGKLGLIRIKAIYNSGLLCGPVGVWSPDVVSSPAARNSQFLPKALIAPAVTLSNSRGEGVLYNNGDPRSIGPQVLLLLPHQVDYRSRCHHHHLSLEQVHPCLHLLHTSHQTKDGPLVLMSPLLQLLNLRMEVFMTALPLTLHPLQLLLELLLNLLPLKGILMTLQGNWLASPQEIPTREPTSRSL